MMRKFLIMAALIGLAACAAPQQHCDGGRDGGIGGTGTCVQAAVAL